MTTRRSLLLAAVPLGAGCAADSLWPKPPPQPALFTLESMPGAADSPVQAAPKERPSLAVATPRAAAGYDGSPIAYLRRAQQIEYFAYARWVEAPAQMLAPLIVGALQRSGAFSAVVRASAAMAAELRLETELIRLLHDFTTEPSQVRLTLRATLIDARQRRVRATREFDATESAASEDPYGGVVAAQRAVQRVLADLVSFCAAVP